jgi:hypothetical protein
MAFRRISRLKSNMRSIGGDVKILDKGNQIGNGIVESPVRRRAYLSTIPDTAKYLGMTEVELQAEIDLGRLPVVPQSDQELIHDADLEDYLEGRSPRVARAPRRGLLGVFRNQR